jgi:hypothetical protein
MASAEWKALVAKSKFGDGTWPLWGLEPKGQICLQDHGSSYRIHFRNIKVLTLAPGASLPRKAPHAGFRWEIQGLGADRRLAVEVPGGDGLEISILDAQGREWTSLKARGSRAEVSIRTLPRGLYWLRVASGTFLAERRFTAL